jgi:hypothetical protein
MMTAAMGPLTRLAAVVLIAVASFACKSNKNSQDRTAAAAASQAAGQIQLVEGGLVMFTDAGSVALGTNSKIPDDFPETIPIYPGARVNMASRSTAQGKLAFSLSLETGDAQPTVVAYYAKGMAAAKGAGAFTRGSDLALGDTQMTVWQSARYDVTLMISAEADNGTAITMTVTGK